MRLLTLLLSLLLADPLAAQTVRVRSGEHEGFTRLAIIFPQGTKWNLGKTEGGYLLKAENPELRFDITNVFSRIPRTRIAELSVAPENDGLHLTIACQCYAHARNFRRDIVVIDIRNGMPPDNSPWEIPIEFETAHEARPKAITSAQPEPAGLKLPLSPPRQPLPLRLPEPGPKAMALRETLMADISSSIASGTLQAVTSVPVIPPIPALNTGPQILPLSEAPKLSPQIRFGNQGAISGGDPPGTGIACTPRSSLEPQSWLDSSDPSMSASEQLSAVRRKLTNGRDAPDPQAIATAVWLHLRLGFGAEARALLLLDDLTPQSDELAIAISKTIDEFEYTPFFDGMQGCDGPAALWATLALQARSLPPDTNIAAVLHSFSRLPGALRAKFGPGLAARLLSEGKSDAATHVKNSFNRSAYTSDNSRTLTEGRIAAASGNLQTANSLLMQTAKANTALAPAAVSAMVEAQIHEGGIPSPELQASLESLYAEYHQAPIAASLAAALAKSYLLNGNSEQAFSLPGADEQPLLAHLWNLLADRGDDDMVMLAAIPASEDIPNSLPLRTNIKIAQRLAELGFPTKAEFWLSGLPEEDTALTRGKIALRNNDAREALHRISGTDGPEADDIRARALEVLGDFENAPEAWRSSGNTDRAQRAAFIAGSDKIDTARLGLEIQDLLRDSATNPPAPGTEKPLATARLNLDSSIKTRTYITDWLATPEVTP